MSATSDPAVVTDFMGNAQMRGLPAGVVTVEARTPSIVAPFSRYQSEAEFLFQRSTPFEVVSKVQDAAGDWHIHLREVLQ